MYVLVICLLIGLVLLAIQYRMALSRVSKANSEARQHKDRLDLIEAEEYMKRLKDKEIALDQAARDKLNAYRDLRNKD